MKQEKGITLIELLVVILVVGILAAVAIPGYRGYMQRGRRSDAKTALEQVRAAQEMWRAERGIYSTNIAELQTTMGAPQQTISPYYTWSYFALSANSFTAQAVPMSTQVLDPGGTLYINNNGTKWSIDTLLHVHNYPMDRDCAWGK